MCQTVISYEDCHHQTTETVPCRSYNQVLRRAEKSPARTSFWRSFFCGSPSLSRSITCTQKPGKRTVFTKCPKCIAQEVQHRAHTARQTEKRVAKAREEHNLQEKARLEERMRTDRKMAFRCSKCAAERRRPDQMSRAANGGLCCAFGIQEFAALEKEMFPPPKTSREHRFPELRYMTSTEKARDDAKAAANIYGWDRTRKGSVNLEPKLVTGYVNHPGISISATPEAKPKYQDLGIDFAVWRQMQDVKLGAHGRIPPPPEKPLPVRPLQLKQKREYTVPRKPIASRSAAPPSPVSPLSPKSQPRQALRRQSEILDGELNHLIDDAMLDYQPIPEPRYRY